MKKWLIGLCVVVSVTFGNQLRYYPKLDRLVEQCARKHHTEIVSLVLESESIAGNKTNTEVGLTLIKICGSAFREELLRILYTESGGYESNAYDIGRVVGEELMKRSTEYYLQN